MADAQFPQMGFLGEGYHISAYGQANYNGVAILSRTVPDEVRKGFPGNPLADQHRAMFARFGDLWVGNVYVVNGKSTAHPDYLVKKQWLLALADHLGDAFDPSDRLVVVGDWNVAPEERDVWAPDLWREEILCSTPERSWLALVQAAAGLVDLHRLHEPGPGPWTWWDYRQLAFPKDRGLRIDLALGTSAVADGCRSVWVDREERKQGAWEAKPSDHAPLVVDLQ